MKFCEFTNENGNKILINMDFVQGISSLTPVMIVFKDNSDIRVQETYEDARKILLGAPDEIL